ncbi:MAG: 1-deoxy-D-xylulose-5-phosphate synthase [Deltaproteobacteria bacterium]|nr:1-deoxy-D-xylulose-5-phosphate synthase [Deltaproteobacteria bacterium]
MIEIKLIPLEEFQRVRASSIHKYDKLALLADMCRANVLASVKRAGSGHLGSSFSAMDIVMHLYYEDMNTVSAGFDNPDRDIYFSSKGHDVPGLYSVLFSLNVLSKELFLKLRRLGGLDGHPHISIPGIEANSGSLGMGISKAKGMALAKKLLGRKGRVFVLTGDGEFQEGQIYEALQTASHQKINNLTVIIDHNKVQSDKPVEEITCLGDLESKLRAFGWHVARCNGHDFKEIEKVFVEFNGIVDKPKVLIADTIKGRGVSFMEHPEALRAGGGIYQWHSGAPDDKLYMAAHDEIIQRINIQLDEIKIPLLTLETVPPEVKKPRNVSREYVADAFGQALVELAEGRKDLIVLDCDLAADCRIRSFEKKYPERFVENGIAEQDMVSMAGGLALQGLLPVVNTFGAFLAARANEQIYTNSGEDTKIIYACHYAGLIPAGPGLSHQSLRDIALLGSLPNILIIQPCNAVETRTAVKYCVEEARENCVLRLNIGPSPRIIELPSDYRFEPGKGTELVGGSDAVMFAYGPVMLNEALLASELLADQGFGLKVINMPWLNRVDMEWIAETVESCSAIYVLEDHFLVGGLGDTILNLLSSGHLIREKMRFKRFAIEDYPAWGAPVEVLEHHRLDGASLVKRIIDDTEIEV